jgi:arginine/ornithine N-succinyltransferase beta subunit
MPDKNTASTKQEFEQAAKAAGFVCVEYVSDHYQGPAVKCLVEQIDQLQKATRLTLQYEQWDQRFVMAYPRLSR